jgi:hypothetical protein
VIIASDVEPIAPPIDVDYDCSSSGRLQVSGILEDTETFAVLFVDDLAVGTIEPDPETGEFYGTYMLAPREESYRVYLKAATVLAKYSEPVFPDTFTVEPAGDIFPPKIEILFPAQDVVLDGMSQVIFTVTDLMGEVDEDSIEVYIDGEHLPIPSPWRSEKIALPASW